MTSPSLFPSMLATYITPLIINMLIVLWSSSYHWILVSTLFITMLNFISSIVFWLNLESVWFLFQHLSYANLFGVDCLAASFNILTNLTIVISVLTIVKDPAMLKMTGYNQRVKELLLLILLLNIFLILTFSSLNILVFFISFEATLIPMYLLIGIFGTRKEKTSAANYLLIFTLIGSLILIISLISLISLTGTYYYPLIMMVQLKEQYQLYLWIGFMLGFMVKVPSYLFHIWLPKAHVESPLIGSFILAAILLKLGTFGIMRFSIVLLPLASDYFLPLIYVLNILGIIYSSLSTIRQIDLKRIVAYSSISHMALTTLGLFTKNEETLQGAWYLMISHAFTSGGLFIIVNMIYARWKTKNIKYLTGLVQIVPLIIVIFFIFSLGNLGMPLTANFVGEFLILLGLVKTNLILGICSSICVVLAAIYSLYFYIRVSYGKVNENLTKTKDLTYWEFHVIAPLLISLIMLGLSPNLILGTVWQNIDFIILSYL